jgi:uncharacterized protein (TIGR00645 family)
MKKLESFIEESLFAARWFLAPMYFGLIGGLIILLFIFIEELYDLLIQIPDVSVNEGILGVLTLIDISLAANLLLIVMFSGYEHFVSRMHINHEDDPEWRRALDASSLKIKLIESIVAISSIYLLKVFMDLKHYSINTLKWMIITHLVFVISAILMALVDRITSNTKISKKAK